ncbi:MAG: hypothetical protein ACRC5G_03335 [Cetobacterium sp.]
MDIHDNTTWIKSLTEQDILEKHFTEARMLFTNTHIPWLVNLKEQILSTYKVKAKFKHLGYNGEKLYCNGQVLVFAKSKFANKITLGKNVNFIEGNIKPCGSNNYPRIGWKNDYCILEFISFGLPFVIKEDGWSIEILEINKL